MITTFFKEEPNIDGYKHLLKDLYNKGKYFDQLKDEDLLKNSDLISQMK
jgi:hypothetical protein